MSLPIKIAYIRTHARTAANGSERSLALMIDILTSRGFVEPYIVTNLPDPQTEEWISKGYEVFIPPFFTSHNGIGGPERDDKIPNRTIVPKIEPLLIDFMRRRDIRIIHCNDRYAMWYAAWSAKAVPAKTIIHIRETETLKNYWTQLCRKICDQVLVLSSEMKKAVEDEIKGRSPVDFIHSFIDHEKMFPVRHGRKMEIRRQLGMKENERAIGVIGQLQTRKQQFEVVSYLAEDPKIFPEPLTIYFLSELFPGKEIYQQECLRTAEQSELKGRIIFPGLQRNVEDWYRAMDVTLMPSRSEGLARAMIESLACGIPVVSTDVCSAREILSKNGCGMVGSKNDIPTLVRDAIDLTGDHTRQVSMRMNGNRMIEKLFSTDANCLLYSELYEKLDREARQ